MKPAVSSLIALLLAAGFPATAAAQRVGAGSPPQVPAPAAQSDDVTVEENVPYASIHGSELHVDIYEPSDRGVQTRPAILLIHGGGWTSFDKSTMRGMGHFLARSGFIAFAVDYRLFKDGENRWPAQLDDVQRAVRWVRANAGKYGVNPENIGAFGHSAGAQLAALLGMENTRDNSDPALKKYSSRVQAVVDVSGPTDFTTGRDPDGDVFFANFLGAEYSKQPEVWRDASPAFHVSKGDAPFLIVHGTKDQEVPISQAQELFDKLKSAHVPVSFIKIDDVHTFQKEDARRELALESRDFFFRYLVGPQ
ncbi:MAG TPA: alpha/beta hydrolase [Terriglobales bacterium]|nr:alpha/beta hydrolase [Terriglobales bacterium]